MERSDKKKGTKKKKLKIFGFSILAIIVILLAVGGYEYYQLQPANHFKKVPVVASGDATKDASNQKVDSKLSNSAFNILLLGSDERKGDSAGHSDSMMIVHLDLKKNEYHALSIPRDTRVHMDGYGYTKLTSVQYITQSTKGKQAGVEAAVKAISELTGIPINYYVETNYWGLQGMVDAVGNVNVDVPFDVKLTHPWYKENKGKTITAGTHTMDGKMVTELVHERYSLKNGEYGRQQLQEAALKGIAKSALSPSNITNLPSLANSISDFLLATNMTKSDMASLGLAVKDIDLNSIQYHQLHGEGKTMYNDVLKANDSEIVLDPQEVKDIANKYFIN
ncbi:LCP family protein [Margalitia sp. FSL K6-0131]|uniref:LCP family protein n=1 Tax=Margalitia sp. FSL K6-0131 TaxID=2954604 RepID=UPI0030F97CF7